MSNMRQLASVSLLASCIAAAGCSLVYKLPVNQGNVIEQDQVDQVQVGMTPEQVEFLLGTAMVKSRLADSARWDYVSYYRSPRDREIQRTVTVVFADGVVSQIEGASTTDDREQSQPVDPPPT